MRAQTREHERPVNHRPPIPALMAALMALVFVLAACGADDGDESSADSTDSTEDSDDFGSSGSDDGDAGGVDDGGFEIDEEMEFDDDAMDGDAMDGEAMEEESMEDQAVAEPSSGGALGNGATRVTPTAADLGRKLIFTAVVQVEVDDVSTASAEATSIIEGLGGFLFGQNTVGGTEARSELIFKVLPDDFNPALEALGAVGELRNQSVTTDDVTERIVDLGSRIQVAELGVARLREALTGSESLEDYAELERLLLDRESDLEVMRGQLRTLQDRVDLATITLILTQDRVENDLRVEVSSYEGHNGGTSCPGPSFSTEAGRELTLCFDVVNNGDQTLTDITLTDTVLEIGPDNQDQLIPVFGQIDELPPGQSALVAFEIQPERDLRLRTTVTAIPTDGVTSEQAGPSVTTQVGFEVRTFESDDPPGFSDGFSVGADILRGLWVAVTVTVGFLILPLLVLGPIVWLLWLLWRRVLKPRREANRSARLAAMQPPPPPQTSETGPQVSAPRAQASGTSSIPGPVGAPDDQ